MVLWIVIHHSLFSKCIFIILLTLRNVPNMIFNKFSEDHSCSWFYNWKYIKFHYFTFSKKSNFGWSPPFHCSILNLVRLGYVLSKCFLWNLSRVDSIGWTWFSRFWPGIFYFRPLWDRHTHTRRKIRKGVLRECAEKFRWRMKRYTVYISWSELHAVRQTWRARDIGFSRVWKAILPSLGACMLLRVFFFLFILLLHHLIISSFSGLTSRSVSHRAKRIFPSRSADTLEKFNLAPTNTHTYTVDGIYIEYIVKRGKISLPSHRRCIFHSPSLACFPAGDILQTRNSIYTLIYIFNIPKYNFHVA